MKLPVRTVRLIKVISGTVSGWVAATFLAALLFVTDEEVFSPLFTLGFGVMAGLVSAWFEFRLLPRYLRRLTAGHLLFVRTLFYAAIVALSVVVFAVVLASRAEGVPPWEVFQLDAFRAFLASARFLAIVLLLTGASFLINFMRQMSRMLGPGRLGHLFFGRYLRPVEEERLFMFLDLAASTALAEKLGALQFNAFKNDFFYDVAEPVLATRGEIYQYVGDEVVVTWPVKNGRPVGDALRCFFLIEDQVERRRARYLRRYNVVPTFKAGLHGGAVVTSEVGDIKREVVHSGDAVNTAARIEGQCRALGRRVLVSKQVVAWYQPSETLEFEDLGEVLLRGKAEAVHLYSVERPVTAAKATAGRS